MKFHEISRNPFGANFMKFHEINFAKPNSAKDLTYNAKYANFSINSKYAINLKHANFSITRWESQVHSFEVAWASLLLGLGTIGWKSSGWMSFAGNDMFSGQGRENKKEEESAGSQNEMKPEFADLTSRRSRVEYQSSIRYTHLQWSYRFHVHLLNNHPPRILVQDFVEIFAAKRRQLIRASERFLLCDMIRRSLQIEKYHAFLYFGASEMHSITVSTLSLYHICTRVDCTYPHFVMARSQGRLLASGIRPGWKRIWPK